MCYYGMFMDCDKLVIGEAPPGRAWTFPSEAAESAETVYEWNSQMFYGTGGTFTNDPEVCTTYYTDAKKQIYSGITICSYDGLAYLNGQCALTRKKVNQFTDKAITNLTNATWQATGAIAVGDYAFYGCNALQALSFAAMPTWGEQALVLKTGIYMKDGLPEVYAQPNISIAGCQQVTKGTNDLSDPNSWTTVTDETKGDYHFFKASVEMK